GIAIASALRRGGIDRFGIFERAHAVGGVWRDNVYPGIECDVPSHLYAFASHPNPMWEHEFARGPEIQAYLGDVVASERLNGHIEFDTPLRRAEWTGSHWSLTFSGPHRRSIDAQVLILACGRLSQPRLPDVAEVSPFRGEVVHSARWNETVSEEGNRIAVVGTGASAIQLVPRLVERGHQVVLFQRTPSWIVPKNGREYSAVEKALWASDPSRLRQVRQDLYDEGEARFASRSGDRTAAEAARSIALDHLKSQVEDSRLRARLTPHYPFGCKRVLLSDEFYPAVASDSVVLESSALAAVDGNRLISATGASHEVDAVVFATGFETTRQPYAELVEGEQGRTLAEHWSQGMTSLGSTLVSGFPDLFILNGPNASLGHNSSILMIEQQCDLVLRLLRERRGPIRPRAESELAYSAEIDERSAGTSWVAPGCTNWYVDERSGRLTLLWPGTVAAFRDRLAAIGPADFQQPWPSDAQGAT
ncbi:MAG: NAD(P)/FAD-dependent oxidoreductase, partial [Microbacterium sp.]|nr:NAD(P)/FAD-dependent oxidoreductase [Microbacterium sp.]